MTRVQLIKREADWRSACATAFVKGLNITL
jgi:hypothetical protein